jgi:hypothetical protein
METSCTDRRRSHAFSRLALGAVCAIALVQTACPPASAGREGIAPDTLPPEARADYSVFAERCSKCHALSRPLNSGIVSDDHWALYVSRMRRLPGSGISPEDTAVILRFLHYYSLDQIRKKETAARAAMVPRDAG